VHRSVTLTSATARCRPAAWSIDPIVEESSASARPSIVLVVLQTCCSW
jgi:hypothetical protein